MKYSMDPRNSKNSRFFGNPRGQCKFVEKTEKVYWGGGISGTTCAIEMVHLSKFAEFD